MTDEEVRAEYQKRIRDYSTPETRVVVEFQSDNRNTVQAFVDLTQQGISVEEALAKTPGLTRKETTLKPADLTEQEYRDFIFALPGRQGSQRPDPSEGRRAVARHHGAVRSRRASRRPTSRSLTRCAATCRGTKRPRLFEKSSEPFRDAAGGQPLEDIGKQFGIPVISLAPLDAQARTVLGDQSQIMTKNQRRAAPALHAGAGRHDERHRGRQRPLDVPP